MREEASIDHLKREIVDLEDRLQDARRCLNAATGQTRHNGGASASLGTVLHVQQHSKTVTDF